MEAAIELVGGKWKLLILRRLIADGAQRFNELARSVTGISHKVLAENLRDLEASRLLEREAKNGQTSYQVTAIATELEPILYELGQWRTRLDATANR